MKTVWELVAEADRLMHEKSKLPAAKCDSCGEPSAVRFTLHSNIGSEPLAWPGFSGAIYRCNKCAFGNPDKGEEAP